MRPLHGVEALREALELWRGCEVLQGKQQVREADGVKELAEVLLDIDVILIQGGKDLEKGVFDREMPPSVRWPAHWSAHERSAVATHFAPMRQAKGRMVKGRNPVVGLGISATRPSRHQ